jgi:hypothetical protein
MLHYCSNTNGEVPYNVIFAIPSNFLSFKSESHIPKQILVQNMEYI